LDAAGKMTYLTTGPVEIVVNEPKDERPDNDALQGTWQVLSIEVGGKPAAIGWLAKEEANARWVVKDHMIGLQSKEPHYVPLSEAFTVRPNKNPKEIDINPYPHGLFLETDIAKGIYTLDGDVWKVCLAKWPLDPNDAPRPKEMATAEGAATMLITLRRVKPEQDKPKEDAPKPSPPGTNPPTGDAGEKEQELLQDWSDAAKKAFKSRQKYFVEEKGDLGACIDSAKRLLTAELARCNSKADRIAACEANLGRIAAIEKIARERFVDGRLSDGDMADAQYYRIEAEILLEREKAK
jgi:uncharacterized protein (TIGR03067 family)